MITNMQLERVLKDASEGYHTYVYVRQETCNRFIKILQANGIDYWIDEHSITVKVDYQHPYWN